MKTGWLFAAVLLATLGCSSGDDAGDGAANGLEDCGGDTAVYARGADPSSTCLGAAAPEIVACAALDTAAELAPVCAQKDGRKYWGRARGSFQLLAGFSACSDPEPQLCEIAACELVKTSFSSSCSLTETKAGWGCGTSDLDEDCCLRTACTSNEDCGTNQHCAEVDTLSARECYVDTDQSCQCAGPTGGLGAMVCVAD